METREYPAVYRRLGAHRAKCVNCGRLIADGEAVTVHRWQVERYYPVKGIMRFWKTHFQHEHC